MEKEDLELAKLLVYDILESNTIIQNNCIEKKINLPFYYIYQERFAGLEAVLLFLDDNHMKIYGPILTSYYCDSLIESAKTELNLPIEEINRCCKEYTSKFPEIALEILDFIKSVCPILTEKYSSNPEYHSPNSLGDIIITIEREAGDIEDENSKKNILDRIKELDEE